MDFDLSKEQEMIRKEVQKFAQSEIAPVAAELDDSETFSVELTNKMGEIGLFGMFVSEKYEGQEMDYISYIIGVEEIARIDGSQAATIAAGNSLGIGPLYYYVLIISNLVLRFFINGPWIAFALVSSLIPVFMYYVGEALGGYVFGLILALLTAFSSGQVSASGGMGNPLLSGFSVFFLFLFLIGIEYKKKVLYSVFAGLSLGLAINSHLQSLGLLVVILFWFVFIKNSNYICFSPHTYYGSSSSLYPFWKARFFSQLSNYSNSIPFL